MGKLLTVEQAAERLGLPVSTIRYWVLRKEGPKSLKLGRRRVFREESIEKFIADQEKASA